MYKITASGCVLGVHSGIGRGRKHPVPPVPSRFYRPRPRPGSCLQPPEASERFWGAQRGGFEGLQNAEGAKSGRRQSRGNKDISGVWGTPAVPSRRARADSLHVSHCGTPAPQPGSGRAGPDRGKAERQRERGEKLGKKNKVKIRLYNFYIS